MFSLIRNAFLVGKVAFGIGKFVHNNSEARKKEKKLMKDIEYYESRNLPMTLMMYVIGFIFCVWLFSFGTVGIVLVVLGLLAHLNNLYEISPHCNVTREFILTGIEILALLFAFFL